eukprot:6209842-Pleurochrysis_carterae.AAC.2
MGAEVPLTRLHSQYPCPSSKSCRKSRVRAGPCSCTVKEDIAHGADRALRAVHHPSVRTPRIEWPERKTTLSAPCLGRAVSHRPFTQSCSCHRAPAASPTSAAANGAAAIVRGCSAAPLRTAWISPLAPNLERAESRTNSHGRRRLSRASSRLSMSATPPSTAAAAALVSALASAASAKDEDALLLGAQVDQMLSGDAGLRLIRESEEVASAVNAAQVHELAQVCARASSQWPRWRRPLPPNA